MVSRDVCQPQVLFDFVIFFKDLLLKNLAFTLSLLGTIKLLWMSK